MQFKLFAIEYPHNSEAYARGESQRREIELADRLGLGYATLDDRVTPAYFSRTDANTVGGLMGTTFTVEEIYETV